MHRNRPAAQIFVVLIAAAMVTAACEPTPTPTPSAQPSEAAVGSPSPSASEPASGSPEPSGGLPEPSEPGADPVPTAADLILADRDAGVLDDPTALLYRVYAIFGDERLPAPYRAGAWSEDEAAINDAVDRVDSLPAAIAAELRPYLVRPTNPDSAFFEATEAASAAVAEQRSIATPRRGVLQAVIPSVTCTSTGWGYIDGTNSFRVWGRCGGDPTLAREREARLIFVSGWMDPIWGDEAGYLGRQPQPDDGTVDNGGADPDHGTADPGRKRIDVYVTTGSIHRGGDDFSPGPYAVAFPTEPYRGTGRATTSSGFIVVNADLVAQPLLGQAALAHELFHVFQNAFNRGGVRDSGASYWFVESSATWAQWRFVPAASAVNDVTMTPGRFEGFQDSGRSLTDAYMTSNRYWSWAWPLFMDQESPGAVANAWRKIVGQSGDAAVTAAISSVIPFAGRFRDFAVRAYNTELSPTRDADLQKLFPGPAVGQPRVPPGSFRLADEVQLHADLPDTNVHTTSEFLASLYAVYRPFKVDDDVGKVVFDFSGLVPDTAYDVDAIVKIKDKGWERRKLPKGEYTFCRDKAKDRVEEIVVVLANHEMDRNARVVGTWEVQSLQIGCAPLTGVLTIERTGSFLSNDPYLEIRRETLTATVVVNMRPDPDTGGYMDAWDPNDPGSVGSSVTVLREWSAEKHVPTCTASYSTKSNGTWAFHDQPAGPDYENGISGFIDKTFGVGGFTMVFHYPYEVVEDICNDVVIAEHIVHDAWICLDVTYLEVEGGPDEITVQCDDDTPDMGYDTTKLTIDGTLYLQDET